MVKRVKHEYSPLVRLAFFNGLVTLSRRQGKTLDEVMADQIETHGLPAILKQMKQFRPRYEKRHASPEPDEDGSRGPGQHAGCR